MNWYNSIKIFTSKSDTSPQLRKGGIKDLLIEVANETLPDFDFLTYKNSCYIFQRQRKTNALSVFETLHIVFSLKEKNFACSISSRLNPAFNYTSVYNTGLLNPHKDLKVLRHNQEAINIQDAYYFHNGQIETTRKVVQEIFSDYKKYGLPFLNKQFDMLQLNEIVKAGLNYIENLGIDKKNLRFEIENELKRRGYLFSNLTHPVFMELKGILQKVGGQSKEDRKLIPKSAYELIELYWAK